MNIIKELNRIASFGKGTMRDKMFARAIKKVLESLEVENRSYKTHSFIQCDEWNKANAEWREKIKELIKDL